MENQEIENLSKRVNELRLKVRKDVTKRQELRRVAAFDKNRFIESDILTQKDIEGLCSRIKRRKHATNEDLAKLGNSFFQSEDNISTFMKITGAINVIIKEFIGNERKISAAKCLCNLTLGNDICCSKIALFSGVYLMIYLRNLKNFTLVKLCLWISQNLASTCQKSLEILLSQELLANCLFIINNSGDSEIKHEGIQLLDIIVEKTWMKLDIDEKENVSNTLFSYIIKNPSNHLALQVLYRTLDHQSWIMSNEDSKKLTHLLTDNIHKFANNTNDRIIYFSIRILSLLFKADSQYLSQSLEMFIINDKKLSSIINEAIKMPKFYSISKDLIKFAASIFQCEHQAAINYLNYDNLVANLQIPEIFDF